MLTVDTEEKTLVVFFDDGRTAEYEYAMLEELELAYCLSVHKSQGSEFACVVIALVFNSIAYVAEIVRAGIDAVDRGQMEAARSLGLNSRQAMVRVILPQAVKNILPALCNEFVSVIKETSLASTFFIGDIMSQYKIINGFTFLIIEPLLIAGIIYFIITFVLSKGIAVLERRMKASD